MSGSGKERPNGERMAIWAVILMAMPVVWMVLHLFLVASTFKNLSGNQSQLESEISAGAQFAIFFMFPAVLGGIVGSILMEVALKGRNYHRTWFIRSALILSACWIFVYFPFGLVCGVILFIDVVHYTGSARAAGLE